MGCGVSSVLIGLSVADLTTIETIQYNIEPNKTDNLVRIYELESGGKSHRLVIHSDGSIVIDSQYAKSVIYCKKGQSFTFTMNDDCKTHCGEFLFDEEDSINGQIIQRGGDSYIVRGKLVKEDHTDKTKGDKTVVIDDTTLQRYTELEKKLEQYEEQGVADKVAELSKLAERKRNSIKQKLKSIEDLKTECEAVITKFGEESNEAKLAKEEYETAQLSLKTEADEYKTICDKLKLYTGDLFDYNILSVQFDDLLNVIFGGDKGSYLGDELEKLIDELEDRKRSIDQENPNWNSAYTELKNCCAMLLKAINYWSSLSTEEDDDETDKGVSDLARETDRGVSDLTRETRSIVILTLEGLDCVDNYLEDVDEYKKLSKDFRTDLKDFSSNIYDYQNCRNGLTLDKGCDILICAKKETANIESWLYDTYLREKSEDSEKIRLQILEEKLKLKTERRRYISEWLNENVGEYLVESTVVSPLPNHGPISNDKEETVDTEFDLETTYKKICNDFEKKDKQRHMDATRAEIDLQGKMRARRQRQRRVRAQKLEEVKLKGNEAAEVNGTTE